MKKQHLRMCMRGAYEAGHNNHPQIIMKEFGITYGKGVPQSTGDQWWFFDCIVPEYITLPEFMTPLTLTTEQRRYWSI